MAMRIITIVICIHTHDPDVRDIYGAITDKEYKLWMKGQLDECSKERN